MLLYYGAFIGAMVPIIWITYLRKIDLFEKEKLTPLIIFFLLSTLIPFLVYPIYDYIIYPTGFERNGKLINDFLYCVFGIGLPEELVKALPVVILLRWNKKLLNEPFDIIIYASIAALGFSFHENILYVFRYGYQVIPGRSIVSSPFHMFCTSIFMYGYVLFKYDRNLRNKYWHLIKYPLFAIVSHGIFDFFLLNEYTPVLWLISLFYFMIMVSVFAVIVNNSLNQSHFFTPKMVVDSERTSKLIFNLYAILFALYLVGGITAEATGQTPRFIMGISKLNAFFVVVMVVRLSRLKLKKEEWYPVKLELPLSFAKGGVNIRGDGFNETYINQYLEEEIYLYPFPERLNPEGKKYRAYIEKKLYSTNLNVYYLARVFNSYDPDRFEYFILNPKRSGVSEYSKKNPIASLLKIDNPEIVETDPDLSRLEFISWVKIIPESC